MGVVAGIDHRIEDACRGRTRLCGSELAGELGLDRRTVAMRLRGLQEAGLLTRGGRGNTFWAMPALDAYLAGRSECR